MVVTWESKDAPRSECLHSRGVLADAMRSKWGVYGLSCGARRAAHIRELLNVGEENSYPRTIEPAVMSSLQNYAVER